MGFANFYRRFIRDFAKITCPLHELTKKNTPWTWGPEQQEAFESLKCAFTTEPILVMWDPEKDTRVESDLSGSASRGALLQKQEDGTWHPVAFRSEAFSETRRNYEIYDCELLAIVRALEDWRHYLIGLLEPFQAHTDHRNLEY